MNSLEERFYLLSTQIEGDLKYDTITRIIYSTDASAYKEMPVAVAWPKGASDIKLILQFALKEGIGTTIRAAGTSLAGQVVSKGIIIDISKYMNNILEINKEELWVRVQPGVVLDELNLSLKMYGLFFGPETSTSNRCNIGGMVGNNACGLHSLVYGSTREHTIEVKAILSDGSEAIFGPLNKKEFNTKCDFNNLEGKLYRNIKEILTDPFNKKNILDGYPDPQIPRRNTGYALDVLLASNLFTEDGNTPFNFSKLLSGSEGTLAVMTEIKLKLLPLPPVNKALICIHLNKRNEAFKANIIALKYKPSAVELMDNRILDLTDNNLSQKTNRFFLDGKPGAIVIVELVRETKEEIDETARLLINDMKTSGYGYAFPIITGKDIKKVWDLRKAGLGVLSNMPGDAKPVSLVEDTAVDVNRLPEYMEEFENLLSLYGKESVYHAHIGTGELHVRPVLNLKDPADVELFREIGIETAKLIKKYKGSMSGEHGDGRLRGEFIPIVLGEHNYALIKKIKKCWDPENILNPGKITDTPRMNTFLRYLPGKKTPEIDTIYDFSSTQGIVRAAEKCNGSGDCRKSEIIGGTMCPSFMATRDEKNTTRARANILREFLSKENVDPWDHNEIYEILDLCLSCKGCKAECPSCVDVAKMKSEFLQHWHDKHSIPLRTRLIAYLPTIYKLGSYLPWLFNFIISNNFISGIIKEVIGFSQKRAIPLLYKTTLTKWADKNLSKTNPVKSTGTVCLFVDEFTNYNDAETGIIVIKLLTALNYKVIIVSHEISGRTFISKGLLRTAQKIARKNIRILKKIITRDIPLIGIEPSAILTFRDEYPDLAGDDLREPSLLLSENSFLLEEFICREFKAGRIKQELFNKNKSEVLLHAHCQQKAVSSSEFTIGMLSIPLNYSVREISSGCCGMAGSFGYEKEHFDLSNKVGELILFPEVRNSSENVQIVAPGTSCRHHIKEGTGRTAVHPAIVLYNALKP
jgi:FAD/FMN-containing dehydrogenase/Fe-S oxidoreductase